MIILTGYIHLNPPDVDGFISDIRALVRSVRDREGCLFYSVVLDDAHAGRMLVVERWRDQGALTTHLRAHDTVAFVEKWGHKMKGDVLKYDASNERALMDD